MDDVEMQAPHGDGYNRVSRPINIWWLLCIAGTAFVVIIACVLVPVQYFSVNTQYSVRIDTVSDLDLTTAGLSFNLTLAVASRSRAAKACVNPGMSVEIVYHGVQLAASEAETREFCAGPRKTAELPVTARATGVPVGHVLESLQADMRHGVAVFDVKLNVPDGSYGGSSGWAAWRTDCKGTRVAGAPVLCDAPVQ